MKYDEVSKLQNIPGIGNAKIENYGEDIINTVKKYIK